MRFHLSNKNNTHLLNIILLFLAFNNCVFAFESLEFDLVQSVPYVSGVLQIDDKRYNVSFLIDVGKESSFSFFEIYHSKFIVTEDIGHIFETKSGNIFSAKDFSFIKCSDFVNSLAHILDDSGYPLVGIAGSNIFGDNILYDYTNQVIYFDNIEFPESTDLSFDYSSKAGYQCIRDYGADGKTYTGRLNTSTYTCQLSKKIIKDTNDDNVKLTLNKIGEIKNKASVPVVVSDEAELPLDFELGNGYLQNYCLYIDKGNGKIQFLNKAKAIIDKTEIDKLYNAADSNNSAALIHYLGNSPALFQVSQKTDVILNKIIEGKQYEPLLFKSVFEALVRMYNKEQAVTIILDKTDHYIHNSTYLEQICKILEETRKNAIELDMPYNVIAEIDYKLGILYMHYDDFKKGYKYLLSAMFVKPSDSRYNFALGSYYLKKGLFVRARSRFIKSTYSNYSGDQYLEQLETVFNDKTFVSLFMNTDDRPKYLARIEQKDLKIGDAKDEISDIVSFEIYHNVNKKIEGKLCNILSNLMLAMECEDLLFINCQFNDMLDLPSGFFEDNSILAMLSESPVVLVINGEVIQLKKQEFLDQEECVRKIIGTARSFVPVKLDSRVISSEEEHVSVEIDTSSIVNYNPVKCELLYFGGFSFYDNHFGGYQWNHRNILIACDRIELKENKNIAIDKMPANFHVWVKQETKNNSFEKVINNKGLNSVFAARSFLIVKIYDGDNKLIAFSKINFIDESQAYYEYF